MPPVTPSYFFCADYSDIAACLFAIQAIDDRNGFAGDAEATRLLAVFEGDLLKKLYNRTLLVFGQLDGVVIIPKGSEGDFEVLDYEYLDFTEQTAVSPGDLPGDFGVPDFEYLDFTESVAIAPADTLPDFAFGDFSLTGFNVGIVDNQNTGYSSRFQTILNIFSVFCSRSSELSIPTIQSLQTTFVPVLDAFTALRDYLTRAGISPCAPVAAYFNNTLNLFLQAAGSDGTTGIAAGIHLRWSLAGDLGNNHLPQGNYYPEGTSADPAGYNKTNDFFTLSRTPYSNPAIFTLDFETAFPAIDYTTLGWTYVLFQGALTNTVRLTFEDRARYNQAAAGLNPQADSFGFLKAYDGPVALTIDHKNAYAAGYDFRAGGVGAVLKLQVTSDSDTINLRRTVTASSAGTIYGDNITKVEWQCSGGFLQSVSLETYDDFVRSRAAGDWTVVGNDFALSLADTVVFDRLETAGYPIDDLWPQYNSGTKVRVANYHDKWAVSHPNDPSVKATVQEYLSLSETDPRANGEVKDEDAPEDAPGLAVSYLDILNLMALDYHWARMLGLGCIDTAVNDAGPVQFIYKISYTNRSSPAATGLTTFEYLSIPTGIADCRLPETPVMRAPTYTLPVDNGLSGGVFDENGYAYNADARLVNIGRDPYNFERTGQPFFDDPTPPGDFTVFEHAQSVFYGIKYRPVTQPGYVKPEITSNQAIDLEEIKYFAYDADFSGTGVLETVPVPDNPVSLYIHLERQDGTHAYAVYGIDWFARSSAFSNELPTDATVFPVANHLLPPLGITVQYIQQEDPLLFTTVTEQAWLSGRATQFPGQDINFTRLTFNWLDLTDVSAVQDLATVVKPQKVNAWFKTGPPLQVTGILTAILPVTGDNDLLLVQTGSYTLVDGSTVSPVIAAGDLPRFMGSLLATTEGQFAVVSAAGGTDGPMLTIKKIIQVTQVADAGNPGYYGTRNAYVLPAIGSRFTVTENLSNPDNWQPVTEAVQLTDFGATYTPATIESATDQEGNISRYLVGGIYGSAVVLPLDDITTGLLMPGYYAVTFDPAVTLDPNPQVNLPYDPAVPGANAPGTLHPPHVEWYNGQIRLPLAADPADKKLVNVIRIAQASPLQVYVYDAGYTDDPVRVSATTTEAIAGINFHPGYRVYLFAEPSPDHGFNGTNILPGTGERDRKTLLGLQTTDTGTGRSGFVSAVSPPAILLARKIVAPVRLEAPITYGLKVRPDATTKAAFTFDIRIAPDASGAARSPFGFMFYRTSHEDILDALYAPVTVAGILTALAQLTTDAHFDQRYLELANLVFDPANPGHFNVFDAEPAPYGFPVPDKTGLTDAAVYAAAITATLLPLMAQTPVFAFIKPGYQTDNKLPVIRTIDGNLIDPSDPAFDPFPMIRQYTDPAEAHTAFVRVTDYSLNGSSRFLYFYAAAEVTNQLAIGPLSPFAGPVTVLHTLPADAPVIRSFTIGPPPVTSLSPVAVTFYLSPFSAEDPITGVRVYRASTQNKTLSLQTMDTFADIPVTVDPDTGGIITADDFSDLPAIPFGEITYYRLAFIRAIVNERDEPETVVGLGSGVSTVNLIDSINPVAPALTYTGTTLSWSPSANKGTYYLYQQNSRGNWQLRVTIAPPDSAGPMTFDTGTLPPTDADGNPVYYRFKVKVQNASGLFNLTDNELTI